VGGPRRADGGRGLVRARVSCCVCAVHVCLFCSVYAFCSAMHVSFVFCCVVHGAREQGVMTSSARICPRAPPPPASSVSLSLSLLYHHHASVLYTFTTLKRPSTSSRYGPNKTCVPYGLRARRSLLTLRCATVSLSLSARALGTCDSEYDSKCVRYALVRAVNRR
jgi:hypothetical protein